MKKQLLLSLIAAGALAGYAAQPQDNLAGLKASKSVIETTSREVRLAEPGDFLNRPARSPYATVSYQYPADSWCSPMMLVVDGVYQGGYSMALVKTRPYIDLTFKNVSTYNGTPQWIWTQYDTQSKDFQEYTQGGDELNVKYILESTSAPELKMNRYTFGLQAFTRSDGQNAEMDSILIGANVSMYNMMESSILRQFPDATPETAVIPVSAGWSGAYNRQGQNTPGFHYSRGTDKDTQQQFLWYGSGSPYDCMASYWPKGTQPYAVKGVYIVAKGKSTKDVKLKARLYEVKELSCRVDTVNDKGEPTYYRRPCVIGDLLAEADVVYPANPEGDITMGSGKFIGHDDFGTYEMTPNIETDCVLVLSGYQTPDIEEFTLFCNPDTYSCGQRGYGYIGNSVGKTSDKPELWNLDDFFIDAETEEPIATYTPPTIFMDVYTPYLITNWGNCPDSYEVAPAGGEVLPLQGEQETALELFSYEESENWIITQANGEDLPEWITVEPSDEVTADGDFNGLVKVYMDVEALPAGVNGRGVDIKFSYPGASYTFTVTQGEYDAVEGIEADSETVAKEYYNLQGQRLNAAPENGVYIIKNIKADGSAKAVKVAK